MKKRSQKALTPVQLQALKLVNCGTQMRLTERGNVLVSRQAKALSEMGLIREAPEKWIAYEPTSAGRAVLADSIV